MFDYKQTQQLPIHQTERKKNLISIYILDKYTKKYRSKQNTQKKVVYFIPSHNT